MFKQLSKRVPTPIAIGIILVLAILVGGFTLWQYSEIRKEEVGVEMNIPEKPEDIVQPKETAKHYESLAKENKDESYCTMIDILESRGVCYSELAILKDEPSICWEIETASLSSSCWEYFGMKDWKTLESKDFSFRFSEDIWEFTKEHRGFIVDGRLLHKILDQCEIWIGAPAYSVCPVGEEPGEETDCEVIKTEVSKIKLSERDFVEKRNSTVRVEQDNHVLVTHQHNRYF